jgi:hypothetical protein
VGVERYDPQYDQVRRYRGVALRHLLERLSPRPRLDLAVLHFANGMAIPVAFRDAIVMKRLDPFVARAPQPQGRNMPSPAFEAFPAIIKKDGVEVGRPIKFLGNKIVVAERWHPEVSPAVQSAFSPWMQSTP